jgi:hypothetical protein
MDFFKDRRKKDRRQQNTITGKPSTGCRRGTNRRNCLNATDPKPWWLKVDYSEEVSAAVVRSNQRPKLYKNTEDTKNPPLREQNQ